MDTRSNQEITSHIGSLPSGLASVISGIYNGDLDPVEDTANDHMDESYDG